MARRSGLHYVVKAPREGGAGPHPLLLVLHGRGADENDLLPIADELSTPFFVVSARAPLPFGPGFAWYPMNADQAAKRAALADSLDQLVRLIEDLPNRHPIDPAQVYTLGFSQGAVMAGSLLVKHPSVPAGTVLLSGYLPLEDLGPIDRGALAGRPVFQAHGTQDPVLPFALGEAARDFFHSAGAALDWHAYPIGHTISGPEVADIDNWLKQRLRAAPSASAQPPLPNP